MTLASITLLVGITVSGGRGLPFGLQYFAINPQAGKARIVVSVPRLYDTLEASFRLSDSTLQVRTAHCTLLYHTAGCRIDVDVEDRRILTGCQRPTLFVSGPHFASVQAAFYTLEYIITARRLNRFVPDTLVEPTHPLDDCVVKSAVYDDPPRYEGLLLTVGQGVADAFARLAPMPLMDEFPHAVLDVMRTSTSANLDFAFSYRHGRNPDGDGMWGECRP